MAYKVIRADLEIDRAEILGFWDTFHSRPLGPKYRQFYVGNPAGPATVWLLKTKETDAAVGMIALFKRIAWVEGKKYLAGVAGDIFVAPRHRALGPALMLARKVVASVDRQEVDFLYTFPNKSSEIIIKRAGCKCLGMWDRFATVTDVAPYLLERGVPSLITRMVSPMINAIRYQGSGRASKPTGEFVCREIAFGETASEHLWDYYRTRYKIIGDRSGEYLAWRFGPAAESRVFGVFAGTGEQLLGYMICSIDDNHLKIRDFLLPDDQGAETQLFSTVVGYAYGLSLKNVHVHLLQNSFLQEKLRRYGFCKRDNNRRVYCYGGSIVNEKVPFLLEPEDWYLLPADSDT